jgi:hypothetical protein
MTKRGAAVSANSAVADPGASTEARQQRSRVGEVTPLAAPVAGVHQTPEEDVALAAKAFGRCRKGTAQLPAVTGVSQEQVSRKPWCAPLILPTPTSCPASLIA